MRKSLPLVSIMIPNYNHSRYLDQCIQSALDQTYPNIEIVVLDNDSQDNSIEVMEKYMEKGVVVCKNPINIFNTNYRMLSDGLTKGKYAMLLCADDLILPTYIEKSVNIMEEHPNVGYVHVERDFITDEGKVIELDPFYTTSFMVNGKDVMPIYMMTTVAHPAQGIFRRSVFDEVRGYNATVDHMNADRNLWFYLSEVSDYAYLREKLCYIRVGSETETSLTFTNFQHPILSYMTIRNFAEYARTKGYHKVYERESKALEKFATELLPFCASLLAQENYQDAKRYMDFCRVISDEIEQNDRYLEFDRMLKTKNIDKEYLISLNRNQFDRKRGYEPPDGYELLA